MNARDVVAAYVKGRADAGVSTSRPFRAIMGRQAKLLLAKGWTPEVCIAAAQHFGASRKHPRFLEEWVLQVQAKYDNADYLIRKAEENAPMAPEVLALLAGVAGKMPSAPRMEE